MGCLDLMNPAFQGLEKLGQEERQAAPVIGGNNPEMNFFGNGSAGDGVEFNSFPTTRSLGVNLKIKF